jgi:hypothetical protein
VNHREGHRASKGMPGDAERRASHPVRSRAPDSLGGHAHCERASGGWCALPAAEAVVEATPDNTPVVPDRRGIARALAVGTSTVDRLRREGMPFVWIGDSPRFELVRCLEWLRGRATSKS